MKSPLRKIVVFVLALTIALNPLVIGLKTANAYFPVAVLEELPTKSKDWADGWAFVAKQIAFQILRELLLNFIRGQGLDGRELIVSSFKKELVNAADIAGADFAQRLIGDNVDLCSPFKLTISTLINQDITGGFPAYKSTARCTITDALAIQGAQLEDYYADFRNGSWDAFVEINRTQNTPLGAYLLAKEELDEETGLAVEDSRLQSQSGKGYIGMEVCVRRVAGSDRCAEKKIITPATTIANPIERVIGSNLDNFIQADTIWEVIVGAAGALITQVLQGGVVNETPRTQYTEGEPELPGVGKPCDSSNQCDSGLFCFGFPGTPSGGPQFCQEPVKQGGTCQYTDSPETTAVCEDGLGCYVSNLNDNTFEKICDVKGEGDVRDLCNLNLLNIPSDQRCDQDKGLVCEFTPTNPIYLPSPDGNGLDKWGRCKLRDGYSCSADNECQSGTCDGSPSVCQPQRL